MCIRDRIDTCDTVVVATGENLESSVLAVMHCKSLGVPTVIAKVKSHTAKKVLEKIGADSVISPEFEMGRSLAQTILFNNSVDVFQLDKNVSIVEMKIPRSWAGKSLSELDLRGQYNPVSYTHLGALISIITVLSSNRGVP